MGRPLNRALISFMLDTHGQRGYREWAPPVLVNAASLTGTGQLPKFADDLYQTTDGLYLIPTAEVPLTNIHRDEVLEAALPLHYSAYTPCFRDEAGSAGRDTRGMIRVHQFDKVELLKFAGRRTARRARGQVTDAERILRARPGLPDDRAVHRRHGLRRRQTYDLEVWLPSYDDYKEISSCSNCSDFQARRARSSTAPRTEFRARRSSHPQRLRPGRGPHPGRGHRELPERGRLPSRSPRSCARTWAASVRSVRGCSAAHGRGRRSGTHRPSARSIGSHVGSPRGKCVRRSRSGTTPSA